CILEKNNIELNVFDEVISPSNEQLLHVAQDITFSGGVPFNKSFSDDLGNSLFQVQLKDQISNNAGGIPNNDFAKIGIAYFIKNGSTQSIRCQKVFSEENTFVTYIPEETWPPNTEIRIHPEAHFQQSIDNGNSWSAVEDQHGKTAQDTVYTFMTGDYPDKIPSFNIEYSYPLNGMSNYYPAQNNGIGVIKLKKGMSPIFDDTEVFARVTCQSPDVEVFTSTCTYQKKDKTITWPMPSGQMVKGQVYQLQLLSAGKDLIEPIYFRCSTYDRLEDKLAAAFNPDNVLPQPKLQSIILENQSELFDELELNGSGEILPLLNYEIDITQLQNLQIYPMVNANDLHQQEHIFFFNQFTHTQFSEGNVPKVEVVIPDQLGESPVFIEPSGVKQKLTSTLHVEFLDTLVQKMILQNYFDLNDPNFTTYFGSPNGFQTDYNYNTGTGLYDNSLISAWELGQAFKNRWQHPGQMKIRWSYRIGDLELFDSVQSYLINDE
ncbi:MAG: hypothetical protein KDC53_25600, partial [Saprospiraceae bacterium]|nr:hypothetical protein [Saprospiraceae bacterium]